MWFIELFDAPEMDYLDAIKKWIGKFDTHYSRFRADSLVSKMSRTTGEYRLPDDAEPMFDLYKELYDASDGLITPLIGQTLSDAGYDATYSLQPQKLQVPPAWEDCLIYDYPLLTVKKPVLLDLGALGKGYLVDIIGDLLQKNGVEHYVINAGGDIFCCTPMPIEVALENPFKTAEAVGIAKIANQALCGSAGNRRVWANFTHILNPKTLLSPQHLAAVWVTADTTMLADALTTALFFMPPEELHKRYTFNYGLVTEQSEIQTSKDFPARFFTNLD